MTHQDKPVPHERRTDEAAPLTERRDPAGAGEERRAAAPRAIDLSVVVIVRDDEDRVGGLARGLLDALRGLGPRFEVFVIDEGSGDNTVAILTLCRQQLSEVEIVPGDPGRGLAIGVERARGRAVLLLDSDGLADALTGNDLVAPFLPAALARVLPPGGAVSDGGDGADDLVVTRSFVLLRRARGQPLLPALAQPGGRRSTIGRVLPGLLERAEATRLTVVRLEGQSGPVYGSLPPWLRRLPRAILTSRGPLLSRRPAALAPQQTTPRRARWRWPFEWLRGRP